MSLIKKIGNLKKKKESNIGDKIYFSISSEGFGHSSRALAIARELPPEQICIGTYSYALDRFKKFDYPCCEIPQELSFIGSKGEFNVGKTIAQNRNWALKFNKLVKDEMKIIEEFGASCVVADGRLVPVMAAEKLGLPCIVITNQSAFYPFFEKNSALVKIFGKSFDWVMRMWLSSTEEILIPDFHPPHTICLPNLSHKSKVMKRTRFVGPLVSWDAKEIEAVNKPGKNPYVVVTLGGHSYRRPLFDCILDAAKSLPDVDFDIFTSFEVDSIPENVNIQPLAPEIAKYMKAADMVITQAGHSTAMELLTLGKSSLIVPDLNQREQENNAARMAEVGVSKVLTYAELDSVKLCYAIQEILENNKFSKNAQNYATIAEENVGRVEVAKLLKEYSKRLSYY